MSFKDATVSSDNKVYVTTGGDLFTVLAFDGNNGTARHSTAQHNRCIAPLIAVYPCNVAGALLWTFCLYQSAPATSSRVVMGDNGLLYLSNVWHGIVVIGLGECWP